MSRFIVTIADDDPTLAAEARAAILAVPGVVGVEERATPKDAMPTWLRAVVDPTYTVDDEDDGAP